MGTNYYVHFNICKECEKPEEIAHIGKKSYGWRFLFNKRFPTWAHWKAVLRNNKIVDEYGRFIEFDEFCDMIVSAQDLSRHTINCTVSSDGFDYSTYNEFS